MANNAPNKAHSGESTEVQLTPQQKKFIQHEAIRLDSVEDGDLLKHFTETWWNLCQWEKQRLDILDTKAQMLLGLSGLATAILGAGFTEQSHFLRAVAAAGFLCTMAAALFALRVRNVGGFIDGEVFGAVSAAKTPVGSTPEFTDKDPLRCYYREIALQRWLVYDLYKKACGHKSSWVKRAQLVAVVSIIAAAAAVILPTTQSQNQNSAPASTGAGSAPTGLASTASVTSATQSSAATVSGQASAPAATSAANPTTAHP